MPGVIRPLLLLGVAAVFGLGLLEGLVWTRRRSPLAAPSSAWDTSPLADDVHQRDPYPMGLLIRGRR